MPMILNGTGDITGLASVNSSVTAAEIGYLDGTTSTIQTQINTKAAISGQTFTGNIVLPYDLNSGGTNIVDVRTITDSSSYNIYSVQNSSGIFFINTLAQTTAIPFYSNGGAGVGYRWTFLDPDTGWTANSSGSFSFVQAGTGTHTFSVTFNTGTGILSIQRTAGTGTYYTKLMILGSW